MTDVTEPDWLDSEQLRSWTAVVAALETLPQALDAQLKRDSGINHFEYSVLAMLSDGGGSRPMSELAGLAFGSLSRLSHAVGRLEQRGWVERGPGPGGRRHTIARLTSLGRAELDRAAPGHVREVRRLLIEPLTDREFATLGRLFTKILEAAVPERAAFVAHYTRAAPGDDGERTDD